MARTNLKDFMNKVFENRPEVKEEYDRLTPEFELRSKFIGARLQAGLTQEEVAKRMGTSKSAISRMESINSGTTPSMKTLMKFADAVGVHLKIDFVK
jgi:DNA-binding XRE family transcriptional regulator